MALERGFQEVSVTRLGYQTAARRFGTSQTPQFPPPDDSDSEEEQDVDNTYTLPRIEEQRMNLTCLSQYYNLYFVAYGDKIYVYRPKNPQQDLPREPDLILEPPQSREAILSASRYRGHIINHLVVGDLGDKEILICACHDGDVVAYYTQTIENALQRSLAGSTNAVKLFFAENVGNSAWGLAVHSQSRLIAVGSNSHEIQVFAFALSIPVHDNPPYLSETEDRQEKYLASPPNHVRFPKIDQAQLTRTDCGKVVRLHNFRLLFKLGPLGHNIPSVAFSNSMDDDADTVIAADIRGALWFFRLWEASWKRLPSIYEQSDPNSNPIGWGVIILPRHFFKPTYDQADTFGWPKPFSILNIREGMVDISKTVQDVRDSTVWHQIYDTDSEEIEDEGDDNVDGEEDEEGGEDEDEDEEEEEDSKDDLDSDRNPVSDHDFDFDFEFFLAQADATASLTGKEFDMVMNDPGDEDSGAVLIDQSALPPVHPSTSQPSIPFSINLVPARKMAVHKKPQDGFRLSNSGELIFQSYRHNITLYPTDDKWVKTQCDNLLRQEEPHDDVAFPHPLADYDRLNMLATIPELSLVLVASQVGRVALITITRPAIYDQIERYSHLGNCVAMRIDLILPFRHEEVKEKIRPSHGLLGMAVGPMQSVTVKMGAGGTTQRPRRWRLMLHYFNHTILSYEISRDEESGELVVF